MTVNNITPLGMCNIMNVTVSIRYYYFMNIAPLGMYYFKNVTVSIRYVLS